MQGFPESHTASGRAGHGSDAPAPGALGRRALGRRALGRRALGRRALGREHSRLEHSHLERGVPRFAKSLLTVALAAMVAMVATPLAFAQQPTEAPIPDGPDSISKGQIAALTLLRFIQRSTGKPVIAPTNETAFTAEAVVEIYDEISPLTYDIVKVILEVNGYELIEDQLDDGNIVIRASHVTMRTQSEPKEVPIIDALNQVPLSGDQLAILPIQLRYADSATVSQTLRELLDVQGAAGRASGNVKLLQVPNTQTLIVKAKYGILDHVRDLLRYIDVEIEADEHFLEVISVYNADAQDVVNVVQEVLDVPITGTTNRTARAPRAGNRTPGAAVNSATGGDGFTRLIADTRTQKIIVDTTSETDLELIMNLVDELDSEERLLRPSNHIYSVKYLKAADLQEDLQALLDGTRTTGGLGGRNTRTTGRTTGGATNTQGQNQPLPSRVIAHDETNSLIIQSEYEEYLEVLKILDAIDKKRRQVFLEVALVQVNEASTLNYTLEYLAGNLDNAATRVAAMSAFGLSTLDVTQLPNNFTRVFAGDSSQNGLLAAVSHEGQLPVLLRAIKTDTDSKIVATPFILADDNQPNSISVETEIFFATNTLNNNFSQGGQSSESAGVTLNLTPTISSSVVLLELSLSVSSFAAAANSDTLPDRSTNTIESRVTIPDGRLFIIGGLARNNESLVVSKVPILGDLPLIGRLFQSRSSDKRRDNLYVFLSAHILTGGQFDELGALTDQSAKQMETFQENWRVRKLFDLDNKNSSEKTNNEDDR